MTLAPSCKRKREDQAFWAAERNFSFLFVTVVSAVSRDCAANLALIPKLHRKRPRVPPFSIIEHTLSFTIFHFPLLLLFLALSLSFPSLPPYLPTCLRQSADRVWGPR